MQGENKRQKKKSERNTYDISSIKRVTKKFLEVHVVVVQNNGKEMYKKSMLHVQSRPIVVFHRFPALHAFAAFIFCLNKL